MQTLLLPAARAAVAPPCVSPASKIRPCYSLRPSLHFKNANPTDPHSSISSSQSLKSLSPPYVILNNHATRTLASAPVTSAYSDESEKAKLAQVSKRLESTSRDFKIFGSFGFWGQLVATVLSAGNLSFSIVMTGKITSPVTFFATAGGIVAAFVSIFWSFGYIRLSDRLRKTVNDPSKAPPLADVVRSLKNGIFLNILSMSAAIFGIQATVGVLVAKALTTSTTYYQGMAPGNTPVLALDLFLVQACGNTILSHFIGLGCLLLLLRSVTLPESSPIL